jgi:hypothetical protein
MKGVYANRDGQSEYVGGAIDAHYADGSNVKIAVAFFTEQKPVEAMLAKGCTVDLVVRLGFPTDPDALESLMGRANMKIRFFASRGFHPKLFIFDERVAFVGSANLTHAALWRNREVVVSLDESDERLYELVGIFEQYWKQGGVLTHEHLKTYRALYDRYKKHHEATTALDAEVATKFGDTGPTYTNRGEKRLSARDRLLARFRQDYQDGVAAFNIVLQAYQETGFRKFPESTIPLRLEVDSFMSWVREKKAPNTSWKGGVFRNPQEQNVFIKALIEEWRDLYWEYFEKTVVGETYGRLKKVFVSRQSVLDSSDEDLFMALRTLHSFESALRYLGQQEDWLEKFCACNDPKRLRETLAYLVYGDDEIEVRMVNVIHGPNNINRFKDSAVQELVGWVNREDLPIINSRTTKVLRYFGSRVHQMQGPDDV